MESGELTFSERHLTALTTLVAEMKALQEKTKEINHKLANVEDNQKRYEGQLTHITDCLKSVQKDITTLLSESKERNNFEVQKLKKSTVTSFIGRNWWRIGALIAILGIVGDAMIYLAKHN